MSSNVHALASGPTSPPPRYAEILANRIQQESDGLAARWLDELTRILPVAAGDVFPGRELLDHIPGLLHEVGGYLRGPEAEEIGANTTVIEKARELGLMRHRQRASVHQLLREYEILGGVLETFIAQETERLQLTPPAVECIAVVGRLNRAMRFLQQATVDTFIAEYTETIEQQTKRLASFNRTIGHELRNPLGTMQLALALLEKDGTSPKVIDTARWYAVMQRNIDHMVAILRSLESLTRATGTPDTPTRQRIALDAIAGEVARQLADMAESRGVEVVVADGLPTLHLDPARLELVLMNLVSNAIKYADPAKAHRTVEIAPWPAAGDLPEGHQGVVVRDNGLGMSPEVLGSIFQPFFRGHADSDQRLGNSGSGLGLAIVEECLRALDGTIAVESSPGAGTTFRVTFRDLDQAEPDPTAG
jgi:signal transduction histidine kinase